MPRLTVIAGPNGSGKSTLIEHLMLNGIDFGYYINADDIVKAKGLLGDTGSRQGQLLADEQRERCLAEGIDFSFETVMSHESKVEFMQRARLAGYDVLLFFIATEDPLLNVSRVKTRVAMGGHSVPVEKILQRYYRTLDLLPDAMVASTSCRVFDNSELATIDKLGLRVIASGISSNNLVMLKTFQPVPLWFVRHIRDDGRIINATNLAPKTK